MYVIYVIINYINLIYQHFIYEIGSMISKEKLLHLFQLFVW